jgi:hypothetical protein
VALEVLPEPEHELREQYRVSAWDLDSQLIEEDEVSADTKEIKISVNRNNAI